MKLVRVGLKKNTGGETKISPFGLNAAEIIHAIGKKKRTETAQAPIVANLIEPGLRFGLKTVVSDIYSSALFLAFKM